jgi:hypothetical protein
VKIEGSLWALEGFLEASLGPRPAGLAESPSPWLLSNFLGYQAPMNLPDHLEEEMISFCRETDMSRQIRRPEMRADWEVRRPVHWRW